MFTLTHFRTLQHTPTNLLTWYSPAGRLEFTGPVITRWIAKGVNYFCSEFGEDSQAEVVVDLPHSWRTLFWRLGAAFAGINCVSKASDCAEMVITSSTQTALKLLADDPGLPVLLQDMGELSLRWMGIEVAGALDAIAEVSSQPDDLIYAPCEIALPDLREEVSSLNRGGVLFITTDPVNYLELTLTAWTLGLRVVWVAPGLNVETIVGQELGVI